MFSQHLAFDDLRNLGALGHTTPSSTSKSVLDSAAQALAAREAIMDAADTFTNSQLRLDVAAAVQQWAATTAGDLDEGESLADRFIAQMVGLADENKDGDLSEDEEAVITSALEAAADYMIGKGVAEADVMALINDGDVAAGDRVAEFLAGELPSGEEAALDDIDTFAFDADSSTSLFDNVLDAVYKKKVVVRGGRKVRVNKRVSGRVVLSGAQKAAIRKARRRAHSGAAKLRRAKSMRLRARSGL